MNARHLTTAITLTACTLPAAAAWDSFWRVSSAKYEPGDCITPTDQSLSFHGQYARVEGVLDFDGTEQPGTYQLFFPDYVPRTPLFAQSIDARTKRVDDEFCAYPQVD